MPPPPWQNQRGPSTRLDPLASDIEIEVETTTGRTPPLELDAAALPDSNLFDEPDRDQQPTVARWDSTRLTQRGRGRGERAPQYDYVTYAPLSAHVLRERHRAELTLGAVAGGGGSTSSVPRSYRTTPLTLGVDLEEPMLERVGAAGHVLLTLEELPELGPHELEDLPELIDDALEQPEATHLGFDFHDFQRGPVYMWPHECRLELPELIDEPGYFGPLLAVEILRPFKLAEMRDEELPVLGQIEPQAPEPLATVEPEMLVVVAPALLIAVEPEVLVPEPLVATPEPSATLLIAVELQMLVAVVPELLPEMLNGVLEPEAPAVLAAELEPEVTPRLR